MRTRSVHPAIIIVWRWHALAWSVFLVAAATVAGSIEAQYLWPMAPILVALIAAALTWFWPAAAYRHLRFGVDATGVVIQRGVFFRSHIALPRERIQHSDVSQGPLQRRHGVATLKFYTAGSQHTKIELPGLAHEDAVELRDALQARGAAGGV